MKCKAKCREVFYPKLHCHHLGDGHNNDPMLFSKNPTVESIGEKKHVRNHMFYAPPSSGFLEFPGPTAADRESKAVVP